MAKEKNENNDLSLDLISFIDIFLFFIYLLIFSFILFYVKNGKNEVSTFAVLVLKVFHVIWFVLWLFGYLLSDR